MVSNLMSDTISILCHYLSQQMLIDTMVIVGQASREWHLILRWLSDPSGERNYHTQLIISKQRPDSKVHGANMRHMNYAIWVISDDTILPQSLRCSYLYAKRLAYWK